jgi:hypothetical protein
MAAVAALIFAGSALALPPGASAPYTTGRDILSAGTSWTAAFLYADAADTSDLLQLAAPATGVIFQNNNLGVYPIGDTRSFSGYTAGQLLTFQLDDITTGNTFNTGVASTNVSYDPITSYNPLTSPAAIDTVYAITLSSAAITALNNLASNNAGNVLIVAYEDRPLASSDRDYNDLIFAFGSVTATPVPEPLTLLLLGMGLVSLGVTARRVKK